MWDAYRGTRSRGGLFLSLLPLSFPLQLGVRRGAAPRLSLNASMLSQASVSPRAQRTMATKFDPRYCLAGWLAVKPPLPSPVPTFSGPLIPYLAPYGESPRVLPRKLISEICETNVFRCYII